MKSLEQRETDKQREKRKIERERERERSNESENQWKEWNRESERESERDKADPFVQFILNSIVFKKVVSLLAWWCGSTFVLFKVIDSLSDLSNSFSNSVVVVVVVVAVIAPQSSDVMILAFFAPQKRYCSGAG